MSEQDKFNNEEEYHFVDDPELISAEDGLHSAEEVIATPETSSPKKSSFEFSQLTKLETIKDAAKPILELLEKNFMLRITLIGVAILFLILIIYRCTAHHNSIAPQTHHMPIRPEAIQQMQTHPQPVQQVNMTTPVGSEAISSQKLIDLESAQKDLQMQIHDSSNQLLAVNENLNVVMESLKQLNEQVTQLAAAVQDQAKVTAVLNSQFQQHEKKKIASRSTPNLAAIPPVRYFLQAVIPGRAWLLDSNGDTFTVREGSKIANYGMIRYIDARRGRVLTSSGKIITFSQDDN